MDGQLLDASNGGISTVTGSFAVRLAYKAIAKGVRLPRVKRLQDVDQQCRTIDEITRWNIDVVLDVGANKGFYAKHLRMLGYTGRILSFEPDPGTFQHLSAMAKGDDQWKVFNLALGDAPGELDFNVVKTGEETVLSSLLTPLGSHEMTVIKVKVETVADVLRAEGISDSARIFLKMDTQGYDLKVFDGAKNLPAIRLLQSEVSIAPLYDGMPHYTESLLRYEQAGFALLDMFVVNRTEIGGILEYDALMVRA